VSATVPPPRLNVKLTADMHDALRSLAEAQDMSYTEVTRRALFVYKFLSDERELGRTLLACDADGSNKRELVLL
jgi:hypothetical protein